MEPLAQGAHPDRPPAHAGAAPDALRRHQRLSLLPAGHGSRGSCSTWSSPVATRSSSRACTCSTGTASGSREVPIPLPKRTYGSSKMSLREVRNSVRLLFAICFKALFNPEKFEIGEEVEAAARGACPARRAGLGRLLGRPEDGRRRPALRRRGRVLPEVDHPPGPEPVRAPLLHSGRASAARRLRRRTSGRRHPPRGVHHGARHLPERASAVQEGQPWPRPDPPRQHLRDPSARRNRGRGLQPGGHGALHRGGDPPHPPRVPPRAPTRGAGPRLLAAGVRPERPLLQGPRVGVPRRPSEEGRGVPSGRDHPRPLPKPRDRALRVERASA